MTLKDLSATLGLSMTTVSRALNGHADVSEATRRRVRAAAEAAGYVPDPRARALATGRAMAIGHVLPLTGSTERANPILADFLAGTQEALSQAGYATRIALAPRGGDERAMYRRMAARGAVDGVILHAARIDDPRIRWLTEIGLPFVVHGRTDPETGGDHPWVDVSNRRAFRQAADILIEHGHRRIALINGPADVDFALRRHRGYLDALEAHGIAEDPGLVMEGEMTEPQGYRAARGMLAKEDRPSAFLAASVISAIGVRRAIHDAGLDCPSDVSILTFDDDLSYFRARDDAPAFAAMKSSVRVAGHEAAELLVDLVEGRTETEIHRLLTARFVNGRSLGFGPKHQAHPA